MNKLELIKTLRNECQISKKEAATIVDLFFNEMANALAKGDRVEIRGLCSFYVKKYKAYAGRNPMTVASHDLRSSHFMFSETHTSFSHLFI